MKHPVKTLYPCLRGGPKFAGPPLVTGRWWKSLHHTAHCDRCREAYARRALPGMCPEGAALRSEALYWEGNRSTAPGEAP